MAPTYKPRFSEPAKSSMYYYGNQNIYHACGMGMQHKKNGVMGYYGNCTAYAWGRMWELTGARYTGFCGNAEDMFEAAKKCGLKTGNTPKLGSFIIWASGSVKNSADGCGHIACVEQINADGSIVVSESGWNSYLFKVEAIPKPYKRYDYKLLGFVYCDIDFKGSNGDTRHFIHDGVSYGPVFNPEYYAARYSDLSKAFGNDATALFNHFITYGMKEQRQAAASFVLNTYVSRYPDLSKAFGKDWPAFYKHYCVHGINEGRAAT